MGTWGALSKSAFVPGTSWLPIVFLGSVLCVLRYRHALALACSPDFDSQASVSPLMSTTEHPLAGPTTLTPSNAGVEQAVGTLLAACAKLQPSIAWREGMLPLCNKLVAELLPHAAVEGACLRVCAVVRMCVHASEQAHHRAAAPTV